MLPPPLSRKCGWYWFDMKTIRGEPIRHRYDVASLLLWLGKEAQAGYYARLDSMRNPTSVRVMIRDESTAALFRLNWNDDIDFRHMGRNAVPMNSSYVSCP